MINKNRVLCFYTTLLFNLRGLFYRVADKFTYEKD